MKKSLVLALVLSTSGISFAEPMDDLKNCTDIKDIKKRLTCYDVTAPVVIAVDKALKDKREAQDKAKGEETLLREKESVSREKERDQQVALAALSALRKMRSQVEAGLSFRTYPQALADVKFGVSNYLESPAAKKNPGLAREFSEALSHYENAGLFWNAVFSDESTSRNRSFVKSYDLPSGMTSRYPGFSQHDTEYGIFVPGGLSVIWASAAEATGRADKLINR